MQKAPSSDATVLWSGILDLPIIVLAHNPDSAMQLKEQEAALVVSGHTHCGQVRLPWLGALWIPTRAPFDGGLHDFVPVPVWVSSGLGEVGLPLRFFNRPSIDVLNIQ